MPSRKLTYPHFWKRTNHVQKNTLGKDMLVFEEGTFFLFSWKPKLSGKGFDDPNPHISRLTLAFPGVHDIRDSSAPRGNQWTVNLEFQVQS